MLENLESAAFIKTLIPLGNKSHGKFYRVIDEYCYFYLKCIEPIKQTLTLDDSDNDYWSNKLNTPEYYSWMGYAFESICYKHLANIKRALSIHTSTLIGAWRYTPRIPDIQGAQIDLIYDRDDGVTTLCEMKFTKNAFSIDNTYAMNIRRKIAVYKEQSKTKNQIQFVLISANGMKENKYALELVDGLVTLDDLFT